MSDGKNDTGKSDGPWIDQVYKNIEADDLLQQEIAKLERSCGPEVTTHRWHQDTAAGLTLGCRNCTAVWNPPPEIRVWALFADALRDELEKRKEDEAALTSEVRKWKRRAEEANWEDGWLD